MLILDNNSRDIIDSDLKFAQDSLTEAYELIKNSKSEKSQRICRLILAANSYILPTRNLLIENRHKDYAPIPPFRTCDESLEGGAYVCRHPWGIEHSHSDGIQPYWEKTNA